MDRFREGGVFSYEERKQLIEMIKTLRQIIPEDNNLAQQTLHPKSKSYDEMASSANDAANQAIEIFSKLNKAQKQRHLDYVKAMLDDSAWSKPGGGLPDADSVAEKNRKSIKSSKEETENLDEDIKKLLRYAKGEVESAKSWVKSNHKDAVVYHTTDGNHITFRPKAAYDQIDDKHKKKHHTVLKIIKHNELQEELSDALDGAFDDDIGLTEDFKRKAVDLFNTAVEQKQSQLRECLAKLLCESVPSPFSSKQQIDVIEVLADRIQQLEAEIVFVERMNKNLREEIQLTESLKQQRRRDRTPKKSYALEESLEEINEHNNWLVEIENRIDPRMRRYVDAIGRTVR
jgi:hypothetical protein